MNWEYIQVSKKETSYRRSCSQVFYKMAPLKKSKNFQQSTHGRLLFKKPIQRCFPI